MKLTFGVEVNSIHDVILLEALFEDKAKEQEKDWEDDDDAEEQSEDCDDEPAEGMDTEECPVAETINAISGNPEIIDAVGKLSAALRSVGLTGSVSIHPHNAVGSDDRG